MACVIIFAREITTLRTKCRTRSLSSLLWFAASYFWFSYLPFPFPFPTLHNLSSGSCYQSRRIRRNKTPKFLEIPRPWRFHGIKTLHNTNSDRNGWGKSIDKINRTSLSQKALRPVSQEMKKTAQRFKKVVLGRSSKISKVEESKSISPAPIEGDSSALSIITPSGPEVAQTSQAFSGSVETPSNTPNPPEASSVSATGPVTSKSGDNRESGIRDEPHGKCPN